MDNNKTDLSGVIVSCDNLEKLVHARFVRYATLCALLH